MSVAIDRPSANSFVTCKLAEYKLTLYASEKYLSRSKLIQTVEDLSAHVMIDYIDDLVFSTQQFQLNSLDERLVPRFRSTSVIAQAQAVQSGLGVAVLPCFLGSSVAGVVPVLPDAVDIRRTFWLVAPPERRELGRVKALWDYVRTAVKINQPFLLGRTTEMVFDQ